MSEDVIVVVGGQFGSEGKGMIAGYLTGQLRQPACVRVAGPNAGHTVYDRTGRRWAFRHIPVGAVVRDDAMLVLAAGSEIDVEVLGREILELVEAQYSVQGRLYVDAKATLIEPHHSVVEGAITTGTTGKGIGAARADRIFRQARQYGDVHEALACNTTDLLREWLKAGKPVLIEGTQGYGLGSHAGYYPYCTSSDCRAIDFLAMAGLSPWDQIVRDLEVWVVARTFPIRIAGNSGPLAGETSWEKIGQPPEYTTVTKKIRRVGEWDPNLVREAVTANGGGETCKVALTFLDYVVPEVAGAISRNQLTPEAWKYIEAREEEMQAPIGLVGTGPQTLVDLR